MAVRYAALQKVSYADSVPDAFFHHLQRALLLALQEQEKLSIPEYCRAEEILARRFRSRGKGDAAQR